jgi:hypothetical protein
VSAQRNNLDLIRLIAATAVLISHSYPLSGHTEPFQAFIGYGTAGNLAVAVFFSIGGVSRDPIGSETLDKCLPRIARTSDFSPAWAGSPVRNVYRRADLYHAGVISRTNERPAAPM